MTEYLDIVNEKDEVVGKDTRENVHKKYQIHRGIHNFVLNQKGEILLQKRSKKKDYYPGYYDASVGAQVLSGESYEKAALQETQEELGFKPQILEKICDYKSFSPRQKEIRRLFVCKYDGPFYTNKEEVESVKFYSPKTIHEGIIKGKVKFTEGFKISFGHYLKYRSSLDLKPT